MKYLLDTHTFLWFITDSSSLSSEAKRLIEDNDNEILLSVASLWEIAIKVSLGKLTLIQPFAVFMSEQIRLNAIVLLNISVEHTSVVATLPFHHRDPFDRLLIAQATVEQLPIISADQIFDSYNVQRLWA
jgi:PIN domain nuclease of toxin-antitoxin system